MRQLKHFIKKDIGLNDLRGQSQYAYDYSELKYKPITAPKEYFSAYYNGKHK